MTDPTETDADAEMRVAVEQVVAPAKALAALFDKAFAPGPATRWLLSLKFDEPSIPKKEQSMSGHDDPKMSMRMVMEQQADEHQAFRDFLWRLGTGDILSVLVHDFSDMDAVVAYLQGKFGEGWQDKPAAVLAYEVWVNLYEENPEAWPGFTEWEKETRT